MSIAAIIFDMDGVLIDSEPAHKLAKERAFARFGIMLPPSVYEQYVGRPDETMMNEVVSSVAPGTDLEELHRLKRLEFEALEHLMVPILGAQEFVAWARSRFRIALATSATARNRQMILAKLGLSECFDFIVDATGFSRPKPDPEVFEKAAQGLKVSTAGCLVMEDSLNGVVAGKAAGCRVAAITTSFSKALLLDKGADYVVQSFQELRELLESETFLRAVGSEYR
jgi:beta-phosphoglucomutase